LRELKEIEELLAVEELVLVELERNTHGLQDAFYAEFSFVEESNLVE